MDQIAATAWQSPHLFFPAANGQFLLPIPVYLAAIFGSARAAATVIAVVNVVLLYLLARRVAARQAFAVATALLLALMPAHMAAANGIDAGIFAVPFVLAWLLALRIHFDTRSRPALSAAMASLAVGMLTHFAAPLTMVLLAILTVGVLMISPANRKDAVVAAAAFGIAVLPLAAWFALHPRMYQDTFGNWLILAAHIRRPWQGVEAFINWNTLGNRLTLYWGFFDPSWLFSEPLAIGVLPLLLLGIHRQLRAGVSAWSTVLLGSGLIAPMAASTFGVPHAITSAMAIVPIAALLAGFGLEDAYDRGGAWRLAGLAMAAAIVIQFVIYFV